MHSPSPFNRNQLLAALPESERTELIPHLTLVDMPLGKALYERWLREFGQSAKWSARGLSQR